MPIYVENQIRTIISYVPNLIAALLILIVGYIVAKIVSGAVRGLLRRTTLDNRLARALGATGVGAESGVATAVFWLIMLFVLIGFFQALQLAAISEPLNLLLAQFFAFVPRLLGAAVLLLLAWVLATVLRRVVTGVLGGVGIDRRLNRMVGDGDGTAETAGAAAPPRESARPPGGESAPTGETAGPGGISLAETLGEVVYWLVFLLFLPAILGALELGGILEPIQAMVGQVLGYLPNILAAGLILVIGWFVARIVRRVVTGLLAAAGADRLADRVGLAPVLGRQTLSGLLGLVVYIFILVPVLISALNALQIEAITGPATNMLNTFLAAVPNIFAAAVVLAIAYVVGRLVSGLLTNLLAGLGFDTLPARLGVARGPATAGQRTPSDIAGTLALVAVMLFAAAEAARLLGFGVLADLLAEFIQLGGRVLLGLLVLGVGLYLANLAADVIRSSGVANAGLVAHAARVAILVLAGAMALRQMGIANEIVNLAFGLLLGAIAVAAALAFGFGGREAAGRELEAWIQRLKARQALDRAGVPSPQAPAPPTAPRPGTATGEPSTEG